MLMSSIMVVGTAVLTYGGYRREFLTMAGGRLAAGFGESLLVAMQAIIVLSFSQFTRHTATKERANGHYAVPEFRRGVVAQHGVRHEQRVGPAGECQRVLSAAVHLQRRPDPCRQHLPVVRYPLCAPSVVVRADHHHHINPCSVSAFAWLTCLLYVCIDGPTLREKIGGTFPPIRPILESKECTRVAFLDSIPTLPPQPPQGVSSSAEGSKMRLSDIKEFPASFWYGL